MAQNMYCSNQKSTNKKYRREYDRIFNKKEKEEKNEKEAFTSDK
jgi:hypothetical protein